MMPQAAPAPGGKKKDGREWTTQEQKAYLRSKQGGYAHAKVAGKTPSRWLEVELKNWFEKFPTEPISERERAIYPDWSFETKALFEEKVSDCAQ